MTLSFATARKRKGRGVTASALFRSPYLFLTPEPPLIGGGEAARMTGAEVLGTAFLPNDLGADFAQQICPIAAQGASILL
jgi:hypothetical protein